MIDRFGDMSPAEKSLQLIGLEVIVGMASPVPGYSDPDIASARHPPRTTVPLPPRRCRPQRSPRVRPLMKGAALQFGCRARVTARTDGHIRG